jgi:hypothetical protein
MKAAELAVKPALILENAMGLYERIFGTHKPLTEIENHAVLRRLIPMLEAQRSDLSLELRAMESLEPTPFGKRLGEANTEYPFLMKMTDASGNTVARLQAPEAYFRPVDGLRYYRLSRELLAVLPALYDEMKRWKVRLPRDL